MNWAEVPTPKAAAGLVLPMPTLPAKLLFPAPVWVSSPDERVTLPEVKVKFLPEAMVVSPFRETAPVPVPNVPEPVWVKLELFCTVTVPLEVNPEVAVIKPEMVGVAVQAVEPKVVVTPERPKVKAVALVPPIASVPELSTTGVVTLVEKVPVAPVKTVVPADPIVPVVMMLSAPVSIAPKPEVIEPEFKAPTVVKEEVKTPVPKVFPLRTEVPLM